MATGNANTNDDYHQRLCKDYLDKIIRNEESIIELKQLENTCRYRFQGFLDAINKHRGTLDTYRFITSEVFSSFLASWRKCQEMKRMTSVENQIDFYELQAIVEVQENTIKREKKKHTDMRQCLQMLLGLQIRDETNQELLNQFHAIMSANADGVNSPKVHRGKGQQSQPIQKDVSVQTEEDEDTSSTCVNISSNQSITDTTNSQPQMERLKLEDASSGSRRNRSRSMGLRMQLAKSLDITQWARESQAYNQNISSGDSGELEHQTARKRVFAPDNVTGQSGPIPATSSHPEYVDLQKKRKLDDQTVETPLSEDDSMPSFASVGCQTSDCFDQTANNSADMHQAEGEIWV